MPSDNDLLSPPGSSRRKISNVTISVIVTVLFVAVVAVIVAVARPGADTGDTAAPGGPAAEALAARPDSNRLSTAPGATVTFVEFLDFECEACGSAYPAVEQLRRQYGDRVDFVIRYFPVQSHFNAERAARAVESAARQGRIEPMYKMMYETQAEWGEQQVPMDARFRDYAQRIGLDMARYDADYSDPATLERVRADLADGLQLGVTGTPTFFVDGTRLRPRTYEDLTRALDDALARG